MAVCCDRDNQKSGAGSPIRKAASRPGIKRGPQNIATYGLLVVNSLGTHELGANVRPIRTPHAIRIIVGAI